METPTLSPALSVPALHFGGIIRHAGDEEWSLLSPLGTRSACMHHDRAEPIGPRSDIKLG